MRLDTSPDQTKPDFSQIYRHASLRENSHQPTFYPKLQLPNLSNSAGIYTRAAQQMQLIKKQSPKLRHQRLPITPSVQMQMQTHTHTHTHYYYYYYYYSTQTLNSWELNRNDYADKEVPTNLHSLTHTWCKSSSISRTKPSSLMGYPALEMRGKIVGQLSQSCK